MKTIKNDEQLAVTKDALANFVKARNLSRKKEPSWLTDLEVNAIDSMIESLEQDIREYERREP